MRSFSGNLFSFFFSISCKLHKYTIFQIAHMEGERGSCLKIGVSGAFFCNFDADKSEHTWREIFELWLQS